MLERKKIFYHYISDPTVHDVLFARRLSRRNDGTKYLRSRSKRPTKFHSDEVALRDDGDVRVGNDSLPTTIPHNEQIIARSDSPTKARICTYVL